MGARWKFPNLLWMLLPRAQWKWKLCLECKGFFLLLLFNSHIHKNLVNLSNHMLKLNPKKQSILAYKCLVFLFLIQLSCLQAKVASFSEICYLVTHLSISWSVHQAREKSLDDIFLVLSDQKHVQQDWRYTRSSVDALWCYS